MSAALQAVGFTAALVASASMAGAAAQAKNADKSRNLPAAVSKAIQDNRPGAEIDKVTVEKENGILFYDFEFKADQGEMDVAEDGTVLDIATVIQMKDVPEAAAAAITKAAKGRAMKRIERSEVRAEIVKEAGKARISTLSTPRYVYEAELSSGEVEVTAEGKVIKISK
jgi:hypothetical protein